MNIDLNKLDVNEDQDRAMLWGAGVPIEVWSESGDGWRIVTNITQLSTHLWSRKFRRKPITRTIIIPQCLTEAPAMGTMYWSIDLDEYFGYRSICWGGDKFDMELLEKGQCFATENDVKAVLAAMKGTAK